MKNLSYIINITKGKKMNNQQAKNERKAWDSINKVMDRIDERLNTARGCDDFKAINKYEKLWDVAQKKLQKIVDSACESFGITSDEYFYQIGC